MKYIEQDYLSVIGCNLLIPIVKLLESLRLSGVRSVNEVQTSPYENGHAVVIILLSIVFLESVLNRTRSIMGEALQEKKDNVIEFFNRNFPDSGLDEKLVELFVIRDVIVHNHIWSAKIGWGKEKTLKLISSSLSEGYGDRKYTSIIEKQERNTKLLKLNVFPTRICWSDIIIVLKIVKDALLFLEKRDRRYVYISEEFVEYNSKPIKFLDLVDNLK